MLFESCPPSRRAHSDARRRVRRSGQRRSQGCSSDLGPEDEYVRKADMDAVNGRSTYEIRLVLELDGCRRVVEAGRERKAARKAERRVCGAGLKAGGGLQKDNVTRIRSSSQPANRRSESGG